MNYAEMSDFEINCAVAIMLGMSHAFFFSKSEDNFCEGIGPKDRGPIWQSDKYEVKGYRVSNGNCFNPCNSWADAGPIMAANGISLVFEKGEKNAALAGVSTGPCMELYYDHIIEDENPLRAAMIVFLMMNEG